MSIEEKGKLINSIMTELKFVNIEFKASDIFFSLIFKTDYELKNMAEKLNI